MTLVHVHDYERKLLRIAAERLAPPKALDDYRERERALELLRSAYAASVQSKRRRLRKAANVQQPERPPPRLLELLRTVLGIAGLHQWALENVGAAMERLGDAGKLERWLEDPPIDQPTRAELGAGLKAALHIASEKDKQTIDARLGQHLRGATMAFTYEFDPRARPAGFDAAAETALKARVEQELTNTVPGHTTDDAMTRFVLGALSLDGMLAQTPAVQLEHIRKLRFESENKTKGIDPIVLILNRDAFALIDTDVQAVRITSNGASPTGKAFFEELAFTCRRLIANAVSVPIDATGRRGRVADALNEYVPGQSGGTLDLPPLDAPDTVGSDLVADNIRAVSLVYASWNLEELKLFGVLDRVLEVFMNGQLPVGFDNGGKALSDYYFSADELKISEAARRMTYSRVLGVPGGEVSREAPPNASFQDLFLRFLASVSEFDRQRRIADVVGGSRARADALSLTGEQVRKAGRDLAANTTLYGYGGTFFVAQKLRVQIQQALQVLSTPEILAAYGVQSPFQVIERVCASDFGGKVPNTVRLKTMAERGKEILDIVAANIPAWLGLSGNDLFQDPFDVFTPSSPAAVLTPPPPDIPPDVQARLARAVEEWLAVNGIKDEQRARLGEPEVTAAAPSIPSATDGGGAAFDQLRQMVSSGQTPSLDQLKTLLPDMGGMVRI
jgi:hypothetical protein